MKRSLSAPFLLEETGAAERQGGGTLGLGIEGIAAGGALDEIAATNGEVGLDGGPEAGGKRPHGRGGENLGGRSGGDGGSAKLPSLGEGDVEVGRAGKADEGGAAVGPADRGRLRAHGGEMLAGFDGQGPGF